MDNLEKVWERIRSGRHTAVLGSLPSELPSSCAFYAVRVSGDGAKRALGPLLEARHRVEQLLGGPVPILDQAAERVWTGLRRRLLGEVPEAIPGSAIVESLNRLRRQSDGHWALVFDNVENADEDSLHLLREMVTRPNWLQVPLLLAFSNPEPEGIAAALLATLTATDGADALVHLEPPPEEQLPNREPLPSALQGVPAEVVAVLRAGSIIGSGFEASLVASLSGIEPLRVLELLQRGADLGVPIEDRGDGRFDLPDDLAQGLRASTLPSLAIAWHRLLAELLSRQMMEAMPPASDLPSAVSADSPRAASSRSTGTVLASLSSGSGALPTLDSSSAAPMAIPMSITSAKMGVPDSVQSGEKSGGAQQAGKSFMEVFPERDPAAPRPVEAHENSRSHSIGNKDRDRDRDKDKDKERDKDASVPYSVSIGRTDPRLRETDRGMGRPVSNTPAGGVPQTGAPPAQSADSTSRSRLASDLRTTLPPPSARANPPEWPVDATSKRSEGIAVGNEARAASHLVAAGELENGAARFLAAAREAAAVGAHVQAVSYAREALNLIESLPAAPRRRRLRVMALCELGRLQWQAVGPGGKFTLASALESLQAARSLLEDDDSAELRTTVVTLLSSVLYDIGDVRSLEKALEELTVASRALLSAGDAIGAARLLNDQAAIYVRQGDPVRASHLLEESHRLFQRLVSTDPSAEAELAETDHLLARLPLHVAARPGREAEAIAMGFRYARAAEAAYRRIGATRELTRVWETLGRLALRGGQLDQALQSLTAALEAQRELGDVLGLARTTAALAEVLFARGEHPGALALLSESIALNLEKGSPIGLAYNRRSLEQLGRRLPLDAAGALQEISRRLTAAEGVLGRLKLPTDLEP